MVDAAIIHQCADPALKPAIVEKFIQAVGVSDPLAVTVRSGNRVFLVTPPKTSEEAMDLARRYVGKAMVRIGVTQYPAGLGISDVSELKPDLVETCANIRMGTALFGKVYRIVVKWYGTPADQAFGDALDAWKTGHFDGKYVFDAPDPGEMPAREHPIEGDGKPGNAWEMLPAAAVSAAAPNAPGDPNKADVRIDLKGHRRRRVEIEAQKWDIALCRAGNHFTPWGLTQSTHSFIRVVGQYALPWGLETPCIAVGAGRNGTKDPLANWPGACDVCPGASVLKVIGTVCARFSNPRLGFKDCRRRGRTADQARVVKMISDKDQRSGHGPNQRAQQQPAGKVAQSELEHRTISALENYRASVKSAESARLQWIAAEAGMARRSAARFRRLYEKAEFEHRAQQLVLNHLIDQLGFVPALRDS